MIFKERQKTTEKTRTQEAAAKRNASEHHTTRWRYLPVQYSVGHKRANIRQHYSTRVQQTNYGEKNNTTNHEENAEQLKCDVIKLELSKVT